MFLLLKFRKSQVNYKYCIFRGIRDLRKKGKLYKLKFLRGENVFKMSFEEKLVKLFQ